ncbi:EamA family transporter [Neptuniibacter pectenicola]|jgi:phosphonate utilization associated putative membrane protein|uniref:EamA family transporter n=1 Tax=Neptuniibacter pectenicola TaxID=1806669 RepID=UPI000833D63E|nr:EamA family transporter [Neptuniibacter pectenicola]|eukprot:gnl/Carplike_NY0171/297_a413_1695.p1 GENE.gnl/Carplike_NY0171/297_a413_1695~~gnl/Carplike_NY0171/297_a413_1695.p1  ORF type:complete len:285 (-),score=-18.53 gnl/Carplike_NY0171/297_a413_1695:225-1079(-)
MDNPYVLIGLSVIMHVTWNLLARHVNPKANYLWWGLLSHCVILGPFALWHLFRNAQWEGPLISAIVITSCANAFYFIALRRAYHYAPVSLVYPLARSSPLLIALWSFLFFGNTYSPFELFAILVSVVGLWIVGSSSKVGDTKKALPWTFAAALGTSIYSLSDKVAVTYLPGFSEQLGFITVGYLCAFISLTLVQRVESNIWVPAERPSLFYIVLGGCCIGTSYALVVSAMQLMPAAHVVSFTNTGIILAVLLSIFVFHEKEQWKKRLIGAMVVSAGLVILYSGS